MYIALTEGRTFMDLVHRMKSSGLLTQQKEFFICSVCNELPCPASFDL